jgi:cell wall-associated NlpC family hydrolase
MLRAVAAVALVAAPVLVAPPALAEPDPPSAVAAPSPPAGPVATDHAAAQAEAQRLRQQVDLIRVRAAAATERYDEVAHQLATLTTREGLARRQLDQARAAQQTVQNTLEARARAIYMSGGSLGLYATVLDGSDPADVAARYQSVQAVLSGDGLAAEQAGTQTERTEQIAVTLMDLAVRKAQLAAAAATSADEITTLLARQTELLAAADATVRRLAAEQEAAAQAAEEARARATLRALGVLEQPSAGVTSTTQAAIRVAASALGRPYQWGATGPDRFDCSGLTGWAYRAAGVNLPRTSRQQWWAGRHVPLGELAPGDLLFWATDTTDPATIHHVALYTGNGHMIEAPYTGATVRSVPVRLDHVIGAVRPA